MPYTWNLKLMLTIHYWKVIMRVNVLVIAVDWRCDELSHV